MDLISAHRDNNIGQTVKAKAPKKKSSKTQNNDITVVNVKIKKVVVKTHKNEN